MRVKLNKRVLTLTLSLPCLALTGAVAWAFAGQQTSGALPPVRVENLTSGLKILSVTDLGEETFKVKKGDGKTGEVTFRAVRLAIQNGYDKGLAAYSVRKGKDSYLDFNGASTGGVWAPGEVDDVRVSFVSTEAPVITLAAALLEDGTGDGDEKLLERFRQERAGVKEEFQRIAALARRVLDAADSDSSDRSFAELQSQLTVESRAALGDGESLGLRAGRDAARQFVSAHLTGGEERGLRSGKGADRRAALSSVLKKIEAALVRL